MQIRRPGFRRAEKLFLFLAALTAGRQSATTAASTHGWHSGKPCHRISGSDNIRDSWRPYGDGDMLSRTKMIGCRSGFYEDHEQAAAFDVVTHAGRKRWGWRVTALRSAPAPTSSPCRQHVPEAVVVVVPKGRTVYRRGRAVATDGKVVVR
ncbi:hypothetical protein ASD99_16470 [Mesorhizobium sp. Root695]|nr:hypothetical protein ASD99_16470 [Mesorhizobium sp. Root695]